MRKLIAITQLSVDGVMQGPGGPEEDPTNGFTHGGWAMPFGDDVLREVIDETMAGEFDMLLGRRTYEIFAGYWPKQQGSIAKAFNKATKYVITRTLDSLDWKKSQIIRGDLVDEVRRLKASNGPELHIWGAAPSSMRAAFLAPAVTVTPGWSPFSTSARIAFESGVHARCVVARSNDPPTRTLSPVLRVSTRKCPWSLNARAVSYA